MSAREWQPGDVIAVPLARGLVRGLVLPDGSVANEGGADWPADLVERFECVRPLVVIDPEDREQVLRLGELIREHSAWTETAPPLNLTAALREFANPPDPKPDEPTGLGAVVEDAEGRRWMRHEHDSGRHDRRHAWYPAGYVSNSVRVTWDDIDAVRILSEGVRDDAR